MFNERQLQQMLEEAIKTGRQMKATNRRWARDYRFYGDRFYVDMISDNIKAYHNNKRIIALIKENI